MSDFERLLLHQKMEEEHKNGKLIMTIILFLSYFLCIIFGMLIERAHQVF